MPYSRKIILAVVLLLITISTASLMKKNDSNKTLKIWTRFAPSSIDPLDYDLEVHHIMMRSTMASLVSTYKNGIIAPQIAKSWSSNEDQSIWRMNVDDSWTFENGDKLNAEIVLLNFKRVLVIKNNLNSQSGLLEFLENSNNQKKLSDSISGLSIEDNTVIFKFTKPMPDFLEKIAFGLYSIAHPSDYDIDGNWINKKKAVFSGAYKITKWSEDEFQLELRTNLPANQNGNNKIRSANFNFTKTPDYKIYDLAIREKYAPSIQELNWTFRSTTLDNNIVYIKVMNWDDSKSRFNDRLFRTKLRNIFYEKLAAEGLKVTTSFFPLSIAGITSFDYKKGYTLEFNNEQLKTQPFFFDPNRTFKIKEMGRVYNDAFNKLCQSIHAIPTINDYPETEDKEKFVFDIQFLGTGILIDDPKDDVKFMFFSKHGIRLPDETGEILAELKNENFDVQKINRILWEQAIIWPVRHYSMGFWVNNDSDVNLSEMNLTKHPLDLQFMYWN